MHTEDLSRGELIRAAVVALLAKPQVQPSALWLASRSLRYQALTWIGIMGGAITLFANLRGVLDLADWARWLVAHWHEWTATFWVAVSSLLQIRLPTALTPLLSFFAFCMMVAIGARRLSADLRPTPLGTVLAVFLASVCGHPLKRQSNSPRCRFAHC